MLAGGPEDPSLGARSKVFTVDRKTGEMEEYATGLFAATDLADSPRGTVYVSELFAGQISRIVRGKPVQVAEVPAGRQGRDDPALGRGRTRRAPAGGTASSLSGIDSTLRALLPAAPTHRRSTRWTQSD